MCQCKTMLKLKKKATASSKDTWKTCTIPGKKEKPSSQIQERRIIGEMQLGNSLRKKIKAPIVNSWFAE